MVASKHALMLKLDNLLTDFLQAYAHKRLERFEAAKQINRLEEITFGDKKQYRYLDERFKALEEWFIEVGSRLSEECFDRPIINRVAKCVEKIGSYYKSEQDHDDKRIVLYDRKRASRVSSMVSVFLRERSKHLGHKYSPTGLKIVKPSETASSLPVQAISQNEDIKTRFKESLKYQLEIVEYFQQPWDHLLSVVNYLLNSLEKKPDIKTSHMAASILYYMKLNGYKVAPYVQRLQRLSKNINV